MFQKLNIKLWSKFTIVITSLILVILILFSLFLRYIIQDATKEIKYDLNARLFYIESDLDRKFLDTKNIFFNLSNSLSKKFIYDNKKVVDELFSYFDNRNGYKSSIPFSPVNFINENMEYVHGKISQNNYSKRIPKTKVPKYFNEIKQKPFELYIGRIIHGSFIKKLVIPLGVAIIGDEKQFIGIVWSGILVEKLNKQLTINYAHSEYFGGIKLRNNKDHDIENSYTFNNVEKTISFNSVFESISQHNSVFIHKELENYPFVIELEIKPEYFSSALNLNILFWEVYFIIFIILFYCLYLLIKHRYKNPFLSVYQKLHYMNQSSKGLLKINYIDSMDKFNPINFAKDIDDLIEKYHLLQASTVAPSEIAIKQKILDLALTEKHFLSSKNTISEDKLYLNKLIKIIDEEFSTASLEEFLTQVSNYCCEFYHEANFKVIVSKKDQKNFSFKSSALNETIFNIITFIIRGNFNICDYPILIKGSFNKEDNFPLIEVEVTISNDTSTTLGWNLGPSYVYSGLLSIYLLAKENNLFFDIKRKDNKLLFILEPLNQKIQFYNQAFENNKLI